MAEEQKPEEQKKPKFVGYGVPQTQAPVVRPEKPKDLPENTQEWLKKVEAQEQSLKKP